MNRYVRYIKKQLIDSPLWKIKMRYNSGNIKYEDNAPVVIFDTSIGTDNIGDEIIMDYCIDRLTEILDGEFLHIPIQTKPSSNQLKIGKSSKYKFVCGTNLLYPLMEMQNQWVFGSPFYAYGGICLLGVGWNSYSNKKISSATRYFYKNYLSSDLIHSVRDNYTKKKLISIGIENVVNTACPSMWKLDRSHCAKIPNYKAESVITTLTDYSQDNDSDEFLMNNLLDNYKDVYLWLQGDKDKEYFGALDINHKKKIKVLSQNLNEYDSILRSKQIDYVGTRLHAGIRALNAGHRVIIIGVDNRAIEISKDTNLCVIKRNSIKTKLDSLINSSWKTEIELPLDNIKIWTSQFTIN